MRKKTLIMSMWCLVAMTVKAQAVQQKDDSVFIQKTFSQEQMLMPGNPTYLKNVSEAANWGRNWFIEVKGGASAFLGSPIGCGDVFDRVTPALQVGLGKWFTPAIGGRIGFQGFSFKNADFKSMKYQFVHADFMYNVTSGIRRNENGIPLWDVIPYLGVGMIRNADWTSACTCGGGSNGTHPFTFSYGIEARYRLNDRLHLIAEVSGMTTAKNFDGLGASSKFGDNMLTVSAGLSLTIGKAGWKRVIDATPYMEENQYLRDYIDYMKAENARLQKQMAGDENVKTLYPKNSYSGLNSLRARLSMSDSEGMRTNNPYQESQETKDFNEKDGLTDGHGHSDQIKIGLGVPVYFFFQLNSDRLVDNSQIVNLDDIAQIAKEGNLKVLISGAADSATGTQSGNHELGQRRANFIAKSLVERGINNSQIQIQNFGGIDKYEANEANRFTIVVISK
ncbi:MAG: OmpA family protein [Prevotella sp.]|nr:OmpA family protein [Prevotella sp.]